MPRFKSLEAQQQFRENMEIVKDQRRSIWFELVKSVIPRKEADAIPKRQVLQMAIAEYESEKDQRRDADPFLSTHSDTFISLKTGLNYWSDIREIAADNGLYLAWSPGKGVFGTTAKSVITRTFEAEQRQIKATAERFNVKAERVNKRRKMELPTMAVQLALPARIGENDA